MQDDRAQAPQIEQERAPWIEPQLSRLNAGSAELNVAVVDDGPGDKS